MVESEGTDGREQIASILFSLSFAGHETTNNLIGNCVRRLLEDPQRWAALIHFLARLEAGIALESSRRAVRRCASSPINTSRSTPTSRSAAPRRCW